MRRGGAGLPTAGKQTKETIASRILKDLIVSGSVNVNYAWINRVCQEITYITSSSPSLVGTQATVCKIFLTLSRSIQTGNIFCDITRMKVNNSHDPTRNAKTKLATNVYEAK